MAKTKTSELMQSFKSLLFWERIFCIIKLKKKKKIQLKFQINNSSSENFLIVDRRRDTLIFVLKYKVSELKVEISN